jgi:hypothetical protein
MGEVKFAASNAFSYRTVSPNDSHYIDQWHLPYIQAPEVWGKVTDCSKVKIAIVDGGVDLDHPDLQGVILTSLNKDFTGKNSVDDQDGHGTHIAGTIGAIGNNNLGVSGGCWKAQIFAVRIFAPGFTTSVEEEIKGISAAIDGGAKIINMSVNDNISDESAFDEVIEYLASKDVLLVASAGNNRENNDEVPNLPTNYPSPYIISVANLARNGQFNPTETSDSNFGPKSVDIAAPGTDILATYPPDVPGGAPNAPAYAFRAGTSMAVPIVVGTLAMYWSQNPEMKALQIKQRLFDSAKKVDAYKSLWVEGRVLNLLNLMKLVPPKVDVTDLKGLTLVGSRKQTLTIKTDEVFAKASKVIVKDLDGNVLGEGVPPSPVTFTVPDEGDAIEITIIDELGNEISEEAPLEIISQKERDRYLETQAAKLTSGSVKCSIKTVAAGGGAPTEYSSVQVGSPLECQKFCNINGPLVLLETKPGTCGYGDKILFTTAGH